MTTLVRPVLLAALIVTGIAASHARADGNVPPGLIEGVVIDDAVNDRIPGARASQTVDARNLFSGPNARSRYGHSS
ncbi:MAG: hypothetical protein AAGF74_05815 [Pseudomonadota bacterium]